jgi:hypothetical protein
MGYRKSRSASRHHHSLGHSTKRAHACSGSERNLSVSPVRNQRMRPKSDILQGELKKLKPPSFDGEHMNGKDVETLFFGMRKYF